MHDIEKYIITSTIGYQETNIHTQTHVNASNNPLFIAPYICIVHVCYIYVLCLCEGVSYILLPGQTQDTVCIFLTVPVLPLWSYRL